MEEYSLPTKYSQAFLKFESHLAAYAEHLREAHGSGASRDSPQEWQAAEQPSQVLQQYFAAEIQGLTEEELESLGGAFEVRSRFRSLHIELQRQMRLMQTDLLFLRSAQNPQTRAQRLAQIQERLESLMSYCALLRGESP